MFKVGELTLTKNNSIQKILLVTDTRVDSYSNVIILSMKYSETDKFGNGITISITKISPSTVQIKPVRHIYLSSSSF